MNAHGPKRWNGTRVWLQWRDHLEGRKKDDRGFSGQIAWLRIEIQWLDAGTRSTGNVNL